FPPFKNHRSTGNHDPITFLNAFYAFYLLDNAGINPPHSIYIAGDIIDDPNGIFWGIGIFYQSPHQPGQKSQGPQLLTNQKNTDDDANDDPYALGLIVPHKL